MAVIERSVQEIGKSFLVSLPKSWAEQLHIKKGSVLKLVTSEQGNLIITPEFTKQEAPKRSTIVYDEHFPRRFFREYFEGNDTITIRIDGKDHKSVYPFLKKFLNVQIIEESAGKIVVKCFKIDDLSMQECLSRMFFLSVSMIDERLSSDDSIRILEMEDTLTKFYYMLVMQIRRFLSEGKFTRQNQISLTRALDFRMVGEKVERVADIIKDLGPLDKSQRYFLGDIKEYYDRSFMFFLNSHYEKALSMMAEERKIKERHKRLLNVKKVSEYEKARGLLQILTYSKEISMLVR